MEELGAEEAPLPLKGGELLSAISNSMVRILREHYGRGPMKAKTYVLSMTREQRAVETFVELADTMVADFDVVEFLHRLTIDVHARRLVRADIGGQAASLDRTDKTLALGQQHGPHGRALKRTTDVGDPGVTGRVLGRAIMTSPTVLSRASSSETRRPVT